MKKYMLIILGVVILSVLFHSCNNQNGNDPSKITSKATRPLTNPGQRHLGYNCFDKNFIRLGPMSDEEKGWANGDFGALSSSDYKSWFKAGGYFFLVNNFRGAIKNLNVYNETNGDTCFGIRIFPALTLESSPKMFLVFFGEYKIKDSSKPYTIETVAYELHSNNNGLRLLNSDSLAIVKNSIRIFTERYKEELQFKSLSFTIQQVNTMFTTFFREHKPGSKFQAGVRFLPAYYFGSNENKIYFVGQAENVNVSKPNDRITNTNGSWYNHIDPCPEVCSSNELK